MGILAYIAVNFLIYFSYLFLSERWMRSSGRSFTSALVAAALGGTAQIIVVATFLGRIQRELTAHNLFWVNVIIALVLLIVGGFRWNDMITLLRQFSHWLSDVIKTVRSDATLTILLILALLLYTWLAYFAVIAPPYSWDAQTYHMTKVGYWMQDARIGGHQSTSHYVMQNYPINTELLLFWNTVFFRNDFIANCTQLFFLPIGILAIYSILRNTGRRRISSAVAALLFSGFPIVIQQSTVCYTDLLICVFFLSALSFLARPQLKFCDLVFGCVGIALYLGSKGTAAIFILGAMIPLIIYHIPHLWRNVGLKRLLGWLIVGVMLITLVGGPTYIFNWVKDGNPVYPYKVEILGMVIFPGWENVELHVGKDLLGDYYTPLIKKSPLSQIYYSWSEPDLLYLYDSRVGGFGPIMFILLMPCMAAALIISILRRDGRTFFMLLILLTAFWVAPIGRFWVRYTMFVSGAFLLSLSFILDITRSGAGSKILKPLILLLFIAGIFLGGRNDALYPDQFKYYMDNGPEKRHTSQFSIGGFDMELSRKLYELAEPGTSIAYGPGLLYQITYPLWNSDYSNRIIWLDADDEDEWLAGFDEWDIDYFVTGHDYHTIDWAKERKEKFRLIMEGRFLAIFEVLDDNTDTVITDEEKTD